MDKRIETLLEGLKSGEFTADEFQQRVDSVLLAIGEDAGGDVFGTSVKDERIDAAAIKAIRL